MKNISILQKATYDRWSAHFLDVLSLFDLEDYILVEHESKENLYFQKQAENIRVALSQLAPDTAFHLVNSSITPKLCWEKSQAV